MWRWDANHDWSTGHPAACCPAWCVKGLYKGVRFIKPSKLNEPDPFISALYLALDQDATTRTEAYRAWLHAGVSDDDLQSIRAHLQQERALGDVKFQNMVQKALG
jgi:hypothetical protein